jgi:arginase family enzyme
MLTYSAVAPATGTPETGGWSTRELREIIRGLKGLNIIAADIVEVAVCTPVLSILWSPC